jgi:hypothetical protein
MSVRKNIVSMQLRYLTRAGAEVWNSTACMIGIPSIRSRDIKIKILSRRNF